METIRKIIRLEDSRSRVNGSLPYIAYNKEVDSDWSAKTMNQGNWGGFVSDLSGYSAYTEYKVISGTTAKPEIDDVNGIWTGKGGLVRTVEMMHRYNELLKILRQGTFIEGKDNLMCNGTAASTYTSYTKSVDIELSMTEIIRNYIPHNSGWFETEDEIEYTLLSGMSANTKLINLIHPEDYEEYKELGGIGFVHCVDNLIYSSVTPTLCNYFIAPHIDVDVLLRQDSENVGVLTTAEETTKKLKTPKIIGFGVWSGVLMTIGTQLHTATNNWADLSTCGITVESQLQTLQLELPVSDDGDYLPGIYKYGNVVRRNASDTYWIYYNLSGVSGYSSYTIDTIIPYKINVPFNSYFISGSTYVGDYISAITYSTTASSITFDYVLGGQYKSGTTTGFTPIDKTGIRYNETYRYIKNLSATTTIDGVDTTIYYDKIDYDSNKKKVYSEDLNLYRDAIISNLMGYKLEDIWSDSGETISGVCFKEDYLTGMDFPIVSEVNVEIDRGSSTAFESHYLLSEINSMEDMENIGNGYFNI